MTDDVLSLLKTGAALADDALERLLPAPTIEQARHSALFRMDRQPRPTRLLVEPADQGRPSPVPSRRLPGTVRELVTNTEQQERNRVRRLEAENDGAHAPIITYSAGCPDAA